MRDLHGIIIGNYESKKLATKAKAKTPQQTIQDRINATRGVVNK
jgi:hypothetical protein